MLFPFVIKHKIKEFRKKETIQNGFKIIKKKKITDRNTSLVHFSLNTIDYSKLLIFSINFYKYLNFFFNCK